MALGSYRGGPTEADRLVARCHQLLGNGTSLTKAQLEALVGQTYALAVIAVDAYLEQRSRSLIPKQSNRQTKS